ncbi:hypothetical protein HJG60_009007 [Phyllostomus discolor]|uniref:Uncharacterized protein n=1 Tax=Phyllostomus discolor TaxID=89673 RepID=A0A833YRY6_9CHIR|nr:hypothetical protein HJG60_009007 [Phyllostomus discolor]
MDRLPGAPVWPGTSVKSTCIHIRILSAFLHCCHPADCSQEQHPPLSPLEVPVPSGVLHHPSFPDTNSGQGASHSVPRESLQASGRACKPESTLMIVLSIATELSHPQESLVREKKGIQRQPGALLLPKSLPLQI